MVLVILGVLPDGVHAKVYPEATTADSVTVAGKVHTPGGPEMTAIGRGFIVTEVCFVSVHPFASTMLRVTL